MAELRSQQEADCDRWFMACDQVPRSVLAARLVSHAPQFQHNFSCRHIQQALE